jgi:hypothetical protein
MNLETWRVLFCLTTINSTPLMLHPILWNELHCDLPSDTVRAIKRKNKT